MRHIFTARYELAQMGKVKARMLGVRSKIFLFAETVQDYGKRSADICLVMQPVGQVGHSLSLYVY